MMLESAWWTLTSPASRLSPTRRSAAHVAGAIPRRRDSTLPLLLPQRPKRSQIPQRWSTDNKERPCAMDDHTDRTDLSEGGDPFYSADSGTDIHDSPQPLLDRPVTPINDRLLEQELLAHHPGHRLPSRLLDNRRRSSNTILSDPHDVEQLMENSTLGSMGGIEPQNGTEGLRRRQQHFERSRSKVDIRGRPPYPVDLRALEYVSNVDQNLVCPICQCPFQKPVQLECDHSFCRDCLQQSFDVNAERQRSRPCPTCRRPHSVVIERQAPRYVQRMLDELVVKCLNAETGCPAELKRAEVQDHISHYCEYQETPCPEDDCPHNVTRRNRDKGCLHHDIQCDNCSESVMARDIDKHLELACLKNVAECPHCSDTVSKKDLVTHINELCDHAPAVCPGSQYGCPRSGKRLEVMAHANHCPVATMTPFLEKEKHIQEEHRAALERLQRRNEIFEGSVKAMQTLLYDTPAGAALTGAASTPQPSTFDAMMTSETPPPFDTPTQHLLSLHESLRDEFSRLQADLNDVDARSTMMIVNESQRNREDMAHTNAAINSMRTQLQWLMSAQYAQRARTVAGTGGGAGPAAGPSGGGMPGAGGLGPLRRLSGQETKL